VLPKGFMAIGGEPCSGSDSTKGGAHLGWGPADRRPMKPNHVHLLEASPNRPPDHISVIQSSRFDPTATIHPTGL